MTADASVSQTARRFHLLGVLWVIYGIFSLIGGLWLLSFSNTATTMFGALLGRVPDPFAMMSDFHTLYAFAIVFSAVCGVVGIVAGLAFLAGQRFGRVLGLIAAFFSISSLPIGTTLGIYSLIVLLPNGAGYPSAATIGAEPPALRGQPVSL